MSRSQISPWWIAKVVLGGVLLTYSIGILLDWLPRVFALPLPRAPGRVLAVLGGGITLVHYVILKRYASNLSDPTALVTAGGLFRFIRHPMYFGDLLLYAGFAWMASDAIALVIWMLSVPCIVAQCRAEDAAMAARFGAAFVRWCERTGMLVPKLS